MATYSGRNAQTGAKLQVLSDTVVFLATTEQTSGICSAYLSITPPGAGMPPHRHQAFRELCLVVAGEYAFLRSETIHTAHAGDLIDIPAGEIHSYTNTGMTPGQILTLATPGGAIEMFYLAIGLALEEQTPPEAAGQLNIRQVIATAKEYGIELLP